jgi:hypothetical protein
MTSMASTHCVENMLGIPYRMCVLIIIVNINNIQYYITVSKQTSSLFEMIYLSDYLTHCANYQCCPNIQIKQPTTYTLSCKNLYCLVV